jgi:hypothetical protein
MFIWNGQKHVQRPKGRGFLDLLAEDSWRNVYAGELELRPPAAPTTAKVRHYSAAS